MLGLLETNDNQSPDVFAINVGGIIFWMRRINLLKMAYFEKMVAWNELLPIDQNLDGQSQPFVDRDPQLFWDVLTLCEDDQHESLFRKDIIKELDFFGYKLDYERLSKYPRAPVRRETQDANSNLGLSLSFVSQGLADWYLTNHSAESIYIRHQWIRRTLTASAYEYIDVVPGDKNYIPRICDLIGDMYLRFQLECPNDFPVQSEWEYNVLEKVTWMTDSTILECLTGSVLKMELWRNKRSITIGDMDYSPTGSVCIELYIPLPFFFTQACTEYLPLVGSVYTDHSLTFTLNPSMNLRIKSAQLIMQTINLNTERGQVIRNNLERPCLVYSPENQHSFEEVVDENKRTIRYKFTNMNHPVQAMMILVESSEKQPRSKEQNKDVLLEPVDEISLFIHTHRRLKVLGTFARRVLPERLLGISNNSRPVYYLPFHDLPGGHGSTFNASRVELLMLELTLQPGKYRISIATRTFNVLCIGSGMMAFKYPSYSL